MQNWVRIVTASCLVVSLVVYNLNRKASSCENNDCTKDCNKFFYVTNGFTHIHTPAGLMLI